MLSVYNNWYEPIMAKQFEEEKNVSMKDEREKEGPDHVQIRLLLGIVTEDSKPNQKANLQFLARSVGGMDQFANSRGKEIVQILCISSNN